MRYAYFPGCSADSTARDQYQSTIAVAERLGIELVEPESWTCCGSTPAHQVDHALAIGLAAANLVKVRAMGLDMVVSCASCYNRMKTANHVLRNDPAMRAAVTEALGEDYDGSVRVRHFIEIIIEDLGLAALKKSLAASLNEMTVASYYGCLLVRPNEVTGFDDPENPVTMDKIISALGGVSVDWPHKVACCGASLTLTRPETAATLSSEIVAMAAASGADCVAVACPMCQINLDMRQEGGYDLPVLYITQLIGLGLGIPGDSLGLSRLIQSPRTILAKVAAHG